MKEYINYENVNMISENLKDISLKIEEILDEININMNKIDNPDYFKSNSSKKMLEKFNQTSKNFYKFYKEIEQNSLYLDRKLIEYSIRTKKSSNYIEDTTSKYIQMLGE